MFLFSFLGFSGIDRLFETMRRKTLETSLGYLKNIYSTVCVSTAVRVKSRLCEGLNVDDVKIIFVLLIRETLKDNRCSSHT